MYYYEPAFNKFIKLIHPLERDTVSCYCDHLTNFAVIVDINGPFNGTYVSNRHKLLCYARNGASRYLLIFL